MKPEPEGWGPNWPANTTPEKYVVALQAHCSDTNMKCKKGYNSIQQSKEMLHQAVLSYNQEITTRLNNDLSVLKSTHMNEELSEEWHMEGLVDKIADYKHIVVSAGPVGTTPLINQLNNKRDSPYNKGRKKFEMLLIQCSCCKCGGHQIRKQVCRIGAQQYHIKSYAEKHLKEFEENTKRYETMNRPKVVKKVCANNLLLSDINHFVYELEDQHSLFHSDYSSQN